MNALEWGMLLLLSTIWGGSFTLTEIGLEGFGPLTFAALRVSIAAIALWGFIFLSRVPMRLTRPHFVALVFMGLINNAIPFSLISFGQVHITSALASILNGATPLFAVVFAHFFTADEGITPAKLSGVFIGFIGVASLFAPDLIAGGESLMTTSILLGQAAAIGATISYAFAGIYGRRFKTIPATLSAAGMLTGSSILLMPVAFFVEDPINTASWKSGPILAVIGIALLCTSFAYLLYFRILATAGAVNLLLVTLLVPVSATLLGITFLGERVSFSMVFGLAFIGIGLAFVDGRPLQFLTRRGNLPHSS